MANDKPMEIEDQINLMKKYVVFMKKKKCGNFCIMWGIFKQVVMENTYYLLPMFFL